MSIAQQAVKAAHRRETRTRGPAHPLYGETLKSFARRISSKNETEYGSYTIGHWASVWLEGKS